MPGVKVVAEDGSSELRLLRIKYGTKGEWVQVYAGLQSGEKILIHEASAQ